MLPYRDSRFTKIALVIFFLCIVVYGYFEVRGLVFGPTVTVTSLVSVVTEPFITIRGHASRISSLSMNGKTISVTEDGAFEEPFVLSPGDNHIALDAADKYGRTNKTVLEIVYAPSVFSTVTAKAAASTTATSTTASSTKAR
jgi:hypothetical protein